ncbi:MAG: DNA repair protein RadC, partial [Thermodesulfovibrionales bacterium]|jgi:DNA repair protein RadC
MMVKDNDCKNYKIGSSEEAYQLIEEYFSGLDREHFVCIMLNTAKHVVGFETVAIGSLSSCLVHPREVFKGAILANSASIIVAHNHPSGGIEPSREDIIITTRLKEAGDLLGITVLDHIIAGEGSFCSLKEKGLL